MLLTRRRYFKRHPAVISAAAHYRHLLRTKKAAFVANIESYRISEPRAFYQLLKAGATPIAISNDMLLDHYR